MEKEKMTQENRVCSNCGSQELKVIGAIPEENVYVFICQSCDEDAVFA